MPTFIVLSTLTDDGAETLVKNPERIKEVNQELERDFGVRVAPSWGWLSRAPSMTCAMSWPRAENW